MVRSPHRTAALLGLAFATACSSATVPDAGFAPDATVRPDAVVVTDTGVTPPDSGVIVDADTPVDSGAADASEVDSGPADTGVADAGPVDPCAPVDRAAAPQRVADAVAAWALRCNPELTAREAQVAAAYALELSLPALTDANLTYDAASAGACGCAVEQGSCDSLSWFRAVPACDAMLVSTSTTFDFCANEFQCPTRHACVEARGPEVAFGGRPPMCFEGVCVPIRAEGETCEGYATCEAGTYCDYSVAVPVCAAKAGLTEACDERPCVGDANDVALLPPNECYYTKAGATCRPQGRAGAQCEGSCHDLYRCSKSGFCEATAGDGQACPTPFDVETPDYDQRIALISEAQFVCRVPARVADNRGFYCTQTGTTTGVATCQPLPGLGDACGIGPGLAPTCSSGAYCPGIDWGTLAPVTSTCIAQLTATATCTPSDLDLNRECGAGLRCLAEGKSSTYTCVDTCLVFPGGT